MIELFFPKNVLNHLTKETMNIYLLLTGLAAIASIFAVHISFHPPFIRELTLGHTDVGDYQTLSIDISTSLWNCLIDRIWIPGYSLCRTRPVPGFVCLPDNPKEWPSELAFNFISSLDRPTLSTFLILIPDTPKSPAPIKIHIHWKWSGISWTKVINAT